VMMFLWLPFLILIPFAIFMMARPHSGMAGCGMADSGDTRAPRSAGSDPIDIARQRLARGEITVSQYEEILRTIR
jgi:uncharacterized membrane protein